MAVPDYEMPKDVVPPGAQTGIYYIPISSVCETHKIDNVVEPQTLKLLADR